MSLFKPKPAEQTGQNNRKIIFKQLVCIAVVLIIVAFFCMHGYFDYSSMRNQAQHNIEKVDMEIR